MNTYYFAKQYLNKNTSQLSIDLDFSDASSWVEEAQRVIVDRSATTLPKEAASRAAICIANGMLYWPSAEDRAKAYKILSNNQTILKEFYYRLSIDTQSFVGKDVPIHSPSGSIISDVFEELKRSGVAVWKGMFDDEFLNSARTLGEQLYREHMSVAGKFVMKDEHRIQAPTIIESEKGNYHFTGEPGNIEGRYRTQYSVNGEKTDNQLINQSFFDPRIQEIVSKYYQTEIREEYFLVESLKPAETHQKLHLDGLKDQMKVMILLDDVTSEDGPLIFQKNAKGASDLIFNHFDAWFKQADDHPETHASILKEHGCIEWVGTGKKGDCIFFDTQSLHRGSPCTTGERRNIVLTFSAKTLRSMVMLPLIKGAIPQELLI